MSLAVGFEGVMREPGLQLRIGPFLVRLRSEIGAVREHLERLYVDYPVRHAAEAHFDVTVTRGRRLHRWIRPQARVAMNGHRPFFPLPERLAGPSIEWGLNWCVGSSAHRWVLLHAAVLERGGRAIIMPAAPGSGKSTLCAALACSGWRLFSDEFTLIDPDSGEVVPAPRPISLKSQSIDVIARRYPDVVFTREGTDLEKLRFVHMRPPADSVRRADERASAGWIVFPKYRADAPTTFETETKAEALMDVSLQAYNHNYLGARGHQAMERLVRTSRCFRLEYSDLDDVLPRLDALTTQ